MKYARRDLLAGAAALVAVPVSAGSSGTATEAIRSVIDRYADAWQRRDPAAFALYHPHLLRECWVYDADPNLLDRFFATN